MEIGETRPQIGDSPILTIIPVTSRREVIMFPSPVLPRWRGLPRRFRREGPELRRQHHGGRGGGRGGRGGRRGDALPEVRHVTWRNGWTDGETNVKLMGSEQVNIGDFRIEHDLTFEHERLGLEP